jgi:Transglycosylase SLT domain
MSQYDQLIADTETKYGIPTGLLRQQLTVESGLNPNAFNPASGATGIAQILPSTGADPGYGINPVDPSNPTASIDFAGHYLATMKQQTGTWAGALQRYGTIDATPSNAQQKSLLQLAQSYDVGGSGVTGTNLNAGTPTLQNAAFGTSGSGSGGALTGPTGSAAAAAPGAGYPLTLGLQSGVTSLVQGIVAAAGDAFKQAMSGLLSGIENWVTRGFLIFIGVVIVAVAAWRLLAPNVPLKEAVMLAA